MSRSIRTQARVIGAVIGVLATLTVFSVVSPVVAHAAGTSSISGHISADDGTALSGVDVEAYKLSAGEWQDVASTATNVNGDYTFGGLDAGDWKVGFYYDEWPGSSFVETEQYWCSELTLGSADVISLDEGEVAVADDVLSRPRPSLSGTIIDSAGQPMAGSWVTLYGPDGLGGWEESDETLTDSTGLYEFYDVDSGMYRVGCERTWTTWYKSVIAKRFYGGSSSVDAAANVVISAGMPSKVDFSILGASGLSLTWKAVRAGTDGWTVGPTYAVLNSNNGAALVPNTTYCSLNGSAESLYTTRVPIPDGVSTFSYRARNPDGQMSYLYSSSIKSDSNPPAAPRIWIASIKKDVATIAWHVPTDGSGSGVMGYIVDNWATNFRSTPTGTSVSIPRVGGWANALIPSIEVRAEDKVGLQSTPAIMTIPWPTSYAEVIANPNVPVGFTLDGEKFSLTASGASQAGPLWLSRLPKPVAEAPVGYRFVGSQMCGGFDGELGRGALNITIPYREQISWQRASRLLVGQWFEGQWHLITPAQINQSAHTVAFRALGTGPFVLLEPANGDVARIKVWFDGYPTSKTSITNKRNRHITVHASITDSAGEPLEGVKLKVQYRRYDKATWVDYLGPLKTPNSGHVTYEVSQPVRANWRVVFEGAAPDLAFSTSSELVIVPEADIGMWSKVPARVKRGKSVKVTPCILPGYAKGAQPLRLYRYHYERGKWKSYGYSKPKVNTKATWRSICPMNIRFTKKGKWRLRVYAPADAGHVATWSTNYSIYVK